MWFTTMRCVVKGEKNDNRPASFDKDIGMGRSDVEHTYQRLLENVHDIVFAVSEDHAITTLNAAFERLTGWNRSEWLGRQFRELLHTEDAFAAETYFQLVSAGLTPPRFKVRLRTRDGGYLAVEVALGRLGAAPSDGFAGIARVMDAGDSAHESLWHQQRFLQSVLDGIPDPIVVVRQEDYGVCLKNQAADEIFPDTDRSGALCCYQVPRQPGKRCAERLKPCPMEKVGMGRQAVTFIREHRLRGSEPRYMEVRAAPLPLHGQPGGAIIMSARDITSRINAEARLWESQRQLDHMLHHDPLTGLANRLLFQDRLEHALMDAQRERHAVGLLFVDLDRFKSVNDALGHEVGDRLLQVVAKRLCKCVRETDTVARLAGDEFVIILERIGDAQHAAVVAQKIVRVLARPIKLGNHRITIGVSVGISLFPIDSRDADTLVQHADTAMYLAKKKGRSQYQFYTQELNQRAIRRQKIEEALGRMLKDGEFILGFLPRAEVGSGRLAALEAQVDLPARIEDALDRKELMEVAKDSELTIGIGQWALRALSMRIKAQQAEGKQPVPAALPVAPREFRDPGFTDRLESVLREQDFASDLLELEFPERVLMEDPHRAAKTLERLRDLGAKLTITEFGLGNFSLRSLARFPLHRLKLGAALVRCGLGTGKDESVNKAIIDVAHTLGLEAVAAGVENEEQRALLQTLGCEYMEGPLVDKLLPSWRVTPAA